MVSIGYCSQRRQLFVVIEDAWNQMHIRLVIQSLQVTDKRQKNGQMCMCMCTENKEKKEEERDIQHQWTQGKKKEKRNEKREKELQENLS